MTFKGKIHSVDMEWNKFYVTFECNTPSSANELMKLKDVEEIDVSAVKHRSKRSKDANAYCWAMICQLAELQTPPLSKEEMYSEMLKRYGTMEVDESGKPLMFSVLADVDMSNFPLHCACIGQGHVGGKVFNHYRVIKGSSEYNTLEMSKFIDGIVSECQEAGIETMTPKELALLKGEYR